tara:strand:+ start:935 stop:1102 length:168 start_codon:yes stop_codon:yes gene_type:complete
VCLVSDKGYYRILNGSVFLFDLKNDKSVTVINHTSISIIVEQFLKLKEYLQWVVK